MPDTRKIKIKTRHTVPSNGHMFFFVENSSTKRLRSKLSKTKSVPDLRSLKRSTKRLYRQKSENSEFQWHRRLTRLMYLEIVEVLKLSYIFENQ